MSKKEKVPRCLSPEKEAILERRYQEDVSRSSTAFIERAVDFYLDGQVDLFWSLLVSLPCLLLALLLLVLDRRRRLRPVAVLCATLQRWWNSLQRRMAR